MKFVEYKVILKPVAVAISAFMVIATVLFYWGQTILLMNQSDARTLALVSGSIYGCLMGIRTMIENYGL